MEERKLRELLREARIKMGMGQAELAKAYGVSRSTIVRLENGTTSRITFDTALSLARILKVPLKDLLENKEYAALFEQEFGYPPDVSMLDDNVLYANELQEADSLVRNDSDFRQLLNLYGELTRAGRSDVVKYMQKLTYVPNYGVWANYKTGESINSRAIQAMRTEFEYPGTILPPGDEPAPSPSDD